MAFDEGDHVVPHAVKIFRHRRITPHSIRCAACYLRRRAGRLTPNKKPLRCGRGKQMAGLQPVDQTARTTFPAWNPFGPFSRSNSTISPSFKVRYPFSWMAEKCTNTSSPVDRWMKPNPLAPLNHFTVPFSLTNCSFRLCADAFPFLLTSQPNRPAYHSSQKQKCRSVFG